MKAGILLLALILTGCASTQRQKILQGIALGAGAGAGYGSTKAEQKDANIALWAATGAAFGAIATAFITDPDAEIEKYKKEAERIRLEHEEMLAPRVEGASTALFGAKVPDKYKGLIEPGEWRILSIDQWVEDGETRLIHQDKIMELVPPTLRPGLIPKREGERK